MYYKNKEKAAVNAKPSSSSNSKDVAGTSRSNRNPPFVQDRRGKGIAIGIGGDAGGSRNLNPGFRFPEPRSPVRLLERRHRHELKKLKAQCAILDEEIEQCRGLRPLSQTLECQEVIRAIESRVDPFLINNGEARAEWGRWFPTPSSKRSWGRRSTSSSKQSCSCLPF